MKNNNNASSRNKALCLGVLGRAGIKPRYVPRKVSLKVLDQRVGGLSNTSKMPGTSISLSAYRCSNGKKLNLKPGSVCHKCYALKGRYAFDQTQAALERRYQALMNSPTWVLDMGDLLARKSKGYHRWHDSGDLQSETHLDKIVAVALGTPSVKHWLPTKEYKLIRDYSKPIPDNLVIRVSAPMVDQVLPGFAHTSSVVSKGSPIPKGSHFCPASTQGGTCGDCRACWDNSVQVVAYPTH